VVLHVGEPAVGLPLINYNEPPNYRIKYDMSESSSSHFKHFSHVNDDTATEHYLKLDFW
jgi:hypothetical protein